MSAPHLPPELLGLIVECGELDLEDLVQVSLTSRTMLHLARPLLYRTADVVIGSEGSELPPYELEATPFEESQGLRQSTNPLLRTLLKTDAVAPLVRKLVVQFQDEVDQATSSKILDALLPRLVNVTSIQLNDFSMLQIESLLESIRKFVPERLEALYLAPSETWDTTTWQDEAAMSTTLASLTKLKSFRIEERLFGSTLIESQPPATFRLAQLHAGRLDQNASDFLMTNSRSTLTHLSLTQLRGTVTFPLENLTSLRHLALTMRGGATVNDFEEFSAQFGSLSTLESLTIIGGGHWINYQDKLLPNLPSLHTLHTVYTEIVMPGRWRVFAQQLTADDKWWPKLKKVRASVVHIGDISRLKTACEARGVELVAEQIEQRSFFRSW
ncbi:hypothetical protein MNV49_006362 [Pseudohyphozyma bogoriensis]|nr:hypothetical protein MNV49_006362 [Pseudohyphozyma bogoriensis]